MAPELFAFGAALCYSAGSITVKLASRSGSPLVGFVIGLVLSFVVTGVAALVLVDSWSVDWATAGYFAAGGLAGVGAGRQLSMWGVRNVGASVAVPVQASSNPLLATAAGVLLFAETAGAARLVGTGIIVAGVWFCARGGSANRTSPTEVLRQRPRRHLLVLIPLGAGAAFATSDVFRKSGLDRGGDPLVGALIGTAAALLIWLLISGLSGRLSRPRVDASLGWYSVYGVLTAAAQVLILSALENGELSVVSPILSSQTVMVLILGAVALRRSEQLRPGTVIGAIMVFLGVTCVAVS